MAKFKTHYDNLNVSRNAPVSVIKAAYKVLCQNYHPDKYTGRPEEALRIMKIINVAYTVLSDSGKRAEHDRWIDRQEREHATDKAQRIMTIITNTYVEPPVTPRKNLSVSYLATVYEFWKKVCSVGNKVRLISIPRSKKLNLILGSIGFVGIVFTAIILYGPDLKTKTVATASVNQDIEAILKKAKHTLNKGQVAKALSFYLQLAEQGNAEAQFQAGLIYANGQGQAKDDKQAVGWLAKAAEQGHREAQTKLGFMYATGRGVAQNYSSAVYWCYKAAEQGDVIAQYNLGLMYAKGQGVAKDNSLAVSWYSKAAGQGDAHAQYNLGDMYANGVGVTKDSKQAAVLYRKAAKQGLAEAIAALKPLDR
ncbi:MAG: J domain-containing protein [Methylobacter sp.]|uniref:J domain-containing protein n=1 Tax=Methylobacter sp. TaxID=2051955 RepID=UPI002730A05A|nr:J domain-containing protein [Methylobacter sp.]MDP1666780.1 J domain-containing protein [Methylobacter sp.]